MHKEYKHEGQSHCAFLSDKPQGKNTKASKMRKKWTDKCETWTDDIGLFQHIETLV